jgi:RND family efflux transporter MFP subunit
MRSAVAGAVVAIAAILTAGCGGEAEGGGPRATVVDTVHVRGEDVPDIVTATGTVEAEHQTVVAAEVGGQVARIIRDEGSEVGAGAPVIQLNAAPYQFGTQSASADLARARAQLANDEKLLERYGKLLAAGAVDQATVDDLEARVESGRAAVQQAQAAVSTARWDLGKATVRAPFAGRVGRRHVQLGEYVDAQQVVFDIVDDQPLKIRFAIPEIYAGQVEVGDQVHFRVRSDTVATRIAEVDYVSPEIDAATRTFEVTAAYTNPDRGVMPGAFADIELTMSIHEDAAVVPESALYTEGEQNYIFVVQDSTAHRREVEIGRRIDGQVEIAKGVRPGESVITAGQHQVQDGGLVQIAERQTLQREQ